MTNARPIASFVTPKRLLFVFDDHHLFNDFRIDNTVSVLTARVNREEWLDVLECAAVARPDNVPEFVPARTEILSGDELCREARREGL